jgi:hypothetical protein
MHLRIRFLGAASDHLNRAGHEERRYPTGLDPELVHVGDLVRHPLFHDQHLYVVARELDLVERCVTVWLDLLPGDKSPLVHQPGGGADDNDSPFPSSPSVIDD